MNALLTAVFVLLIASEAVTARLRGTGNTSRSRGTMKNNNQERNLQQNDPLSDAPSDIPFFVDGAIFVPESSTSSPTNFPTTSPTFRPTAFPTWTFKTEDTQIFEEAKVPEVCEFCPRGCYFGTKVVDFGRGAQATCSKIMDIAPSLTPFQCNIDRELIESTCCCHSVPKTESRVEPDVAIPLPAETSPAEASPAEIPEHEKIGACDFCVNQEFLSHPIIRFDRGDSVSCRGLKDLLQVGTLPEQFCRMEREAIEDACCQPNVDSEPIVVTRTSPEARVDDTKIDSSVVLTSTSESEDDEDDGSCTICEGRNFLIGPTINFSTGDSVSCAGLKSLVGMGLPPTFCKNERATIEASCCPQNEVSEPIAAVFEPLPIMNPPDDTIVDETLVDETLVEASRSEETFVDESDGDESSIDAIRIEESASSIIDDDPCSFCVGQDFLTRPIIKFSNGNDSVSCGGLKDLVHMGLPPMFCRAERRNIEETCCQQIRTSESISRPISIADTQLQTSPTAAPTSAPTAKLTSEPTAVPTANPTANPTSKPTEEPTVQLTTEPTAEPSAMPTLTPSVAEVINPVTQEFMETVTEPVSTPIAVSLTASPNRGIILGDNESSTTGIRGRGDFFEDSEGRNRQGFFANPTASIEAQNNILREFEGSLISTEHNGRKGFFAALTDTGEDQIHLQQNSYTSTATENNRQGFFASEIILEKPEGKSEPDGENRGIIGKSTGLFKSSSQDLFTWTGADAGNTIHDTDLRDYLVFTGGSYQGRQVTTSF